MDDVPTALSSDLDTDSAEDYTGAELTNTERTRLDQYEEEDVNTEDDWALRPNDASD